MMMKSERGIAMVATLLVMLLMTALMVGFTTVVMSDQRFRGIDKDRTQAFYAAHSGLEKLTADLHNLFFATVAPTQAQLDAIMATPPTITGITFRAQDGTNLYTLRVPAGGQTVHTVKWDRRPGAPECATPPAGSAPAGTYLVEAKAPGLAKAQTSFVLSKD